MKISNLVTWLTALIILLALVATSIGLFWQDEGNLFSFNTLRGDTVLIVGRGLYRYDTTLMAMGFKAGDAVTLILGIPALIFSLLRFWPVLSIIPALVEGKAPPEVWSYTTVITYAIDMGIVAPALIAAGVMLLHQKPLGYLLSSTLLVFTAMLGTNLLTAGTIQMLTGFIDIPQFIGFVASFAILTLYAIWFTLALFRNLSDGISHEA